jgi:hypothetical protein
MKRREQRRKSEGGKFGLFLAREGMGCHFSRAILIHFGGVGSAFDPAADKEKKRCRDLERACPVG